MKLTEFPKVRYSMMEYHLFDTLPKNGRKVGSEYIAAQRMKMGEWNVINPLKIITVTMNRLIEKVDTNREEFKIRKAGKEPGHPEVEYWIEPRKRNGK